MLHFIIRIIRTNLKNFEIDYYFFLTNWLDFAFLNSTGLGVMWELLLKGLTNRSNFFWKSACLGDGSYLIMIGEIALFGNLIIFLGESCFIQVSLEPMGLMYVPGVTETVNLIQFTD